MGKVCLYPPLIVNIKRNNAHIYSTCVYPTWSGVLQPEPCPSASLRSCWRWSLSDLLQLQNTNTSWLSLTEELHSPHHQTGSCSWALVLNNRQNFVLFYDAAFFFLLSVCFVRSQWPCPLTLCHQNQISSSLRWSRHLFQIWRNSLEVVETSAS